MRFAERIYHLEINGGDWYDYAKLQFYAMEIIGALLFAKKRSSNFINESPFDEKWRIFWKTIQHLASIVLTGEGHELTKSFFYDNFPDQNRIQMVEIGFLYIVQLYVLMST